MAGLAESPSSVEKLTHAHPKVSRDFVRCTGVTGLGHIVDAAAAERPDSMATDRPSATLSLDETRLASSLQTSSSADQRRESHRRINQPTESMYRASSSSPEPGRRARCDAERCIGIISPAWHLAVYG